MPNVIAAIAAMTAFVAVLVAAPAASIATPRSRLTAHAIRIGDHPATVRFVVDFTRGHVTSNQVQLLIVNAGAGVWQVRVAAPGIRGSLSSVAVDVGVKLVRDSNALTVRIATLPGPLHLPRV